MATEQAARTSAQTGIFAVRFVDDLGSRVVIVEAPSVDALLDDAVLRKVGGSLSSFKFAVPASGDFLVEGFDFSSTEVKCTAVSPRAMEVFYSAYGFGVVSFKTKKSQAQHVLDYLGLEGLSEVRW